MVLFATPMYSQVSPPPPCSAYRPRPPAHSTFRQSYDRWATLIHITPNYFESTVRLSLQKPKCSLNYQPVVWPWNFWSFRPGGTQPSCMCYDVYLIELTQLVLSSFPKIILLITFIIAFELQIFFTRGDFPIALKHDGRGNRISWKVLLFDHRYFTSLSSLGSVSM